ncbi:MAG: Ig-like domain-containing protein, partial [Candidatus Binatia bacterium]
NSGLSAQATVTVQTFAPTPLSFVNIPGTTNNVDVSGDFAYIAAGSTGLQVVDVANPQALALAGSRDTPGFANDVVVVGSTAYVADGSSGLQIIDVTDPRNPVSLGALDTPGDAQDVVVEGTRAFIADGANGLRIIDVSDPLAPALIGSVGNISTALGVDVDPQRNLAVVASSSVGIKVVDITNAAAPTVIGSLDTGTANDVVVRDGFAFVADVASSFTVIDLSNPSVPVVRASTPSSTGGLLNDVALSGRFSFGADIFFINGVPIIDISTLATPIPRAILNFSGFGDDNATGIAVDSAFVYLTTDRNRMLVGQYLQLEDTAGIPPMVRIIAPGGVVEGTTLPIAVEATDDVAVAAVSFVVNGTVVFTDTTSPYQFNFAVPGGTAGTPLSLSATAADLAENQAASDEIRVAVLTEGGDEDGDGLPNIVEQRLGLDPTKPDTDGDGIPDGSEDTDRDGVPNAVELTLGTDSGDADTDNDGINDGEEVVPGADGYITNPLLADTDSDGTRDGVEVTSGCDPLVPELTTAIGRTVDEQGVPVAGAEARVRDKTDITDAQGAFAIAQVRACPFNIRVVGDTVVGTTRLRGVSASAPPVVDGVTDVGDIILRPTVSSLYLGEKFLAGGGPVSVAVADLNGDTLLDVVTANSTSDDVSVLLQQ